MASRKKIPKETLLKLWVLSGGRCEFPGCNKLVWREGLTLKEDNFAHVAHNVAASAAGPRGHKSLSPKLQTEYDNLLLLCLEHSKLVDGRNAKEYSVEQLREYKQRHEERIRTQTGVGPQFATTVVRFLSPIRDRRTAIPTAEAYSAISPRYPSDDKGVLFDFSTKPGTGDKSYWQEFAREISEQVRITLRTGNDGQRYEHLSVFALAPIPVLVHLGNQIGNIVPVDLYQKHRDTGDWKWKAEPQSDPFNFQVARHKGTDSTTIALVLSLSGKIAPEEYRGIVGNSWIYEIATETPGPEFLKYRSRLEKFRVLFREVLSEIRATHGSSCTVHLFPAIPAPVAVLCGRELLPKSDPSMLVYDNDRAKGGFVPTLTIN